MCMRIQQHSNYRRWQMYCNEKTKEFRIFNPIESFRSIQHGTIHSTTITDVVCHSLLKNHTTLWAIKRSQLIFVCNFVRNQRISIQYSMLDLAMNDTCEFMDIAHLT